MGALVAWEGRVISIRAWARRRSASRVELGVWVEMDWVPQAATVRVRVYMVCGQMIRAMLVV